MARAPGAGRGHLGLRTGRGIALRRRVDAVLFQTTHAMRDDPVKDAIKKGWHVAKAKKFAMLVAHKHVPNSACF